MNHYKILYSVLFFLFLVNTNAKSQSLVFEEETNKVSTIMDQVPKGGALLVFESGLNLEFGSSMENLGKPERKGNLYKVFVTERTCVINIKETRTNSQVHIGFGQYSQNGYPTLKVGEKKYFMIRLEDKLEVVNQTEELKTQLHDDQMRHEKEALIVVNSNPTDLDLEFTEDSSVPITEIRKDPNDVNRYLLYVKPQDQVIKINHKESGAYESIILKNLLAKEVRYFLVILPDNLRIGATTEGIKVIFRMNQSDVYIRLDEMAPVQALESSTVFIVPAGEHTFRFIKNGFKDEILNINVQEEQTIDISLSPGTSATRLTLNRYIIVTSEPSGAEVFLNEQRVSTTPYQHKHIAGAYNLMLRYPLYYDHNEHFNLSEDANFIVPPVKMKPHFGYWQVSSSQLDAEVYLDNKLIGKTPILHSKIRSGEHNLRIKKDLYHEYNENFTIADGDDKKINVQLEEAYGLLKIITTPPGAALFIDGKQSGVTPYENRQQPSGNYNIRLSKDLYHEHLESLTLSDGENKILNIQLKEAFGQLKITSDPPGAKVFIEGVEVGVTPYENPQQPAGSLNIRLTKELYSDTREQAIVSDGQKTERFLPLSRNYGTLKVNAPEADIYIGNNKVGSGSYVANLTPGQYKLKASRYLHTDDEREVFIMLGQTENIKLSPKPRQGALSISSIPFETRGAEIYINGRKLSETTPATLPALIGNHTITIKKQGYLEVSQSIEVKENREQELVFNMQTFDGSMMQKASKHKTAKILYGSATLAAIGTGAYFSYSAMKLAKEYNTATSDATAVYDKYEQHNLYSYIAFGTAIPLGVMTLVKMAQQKKVMKKMNLTVLPSNDGMMFYLAWNF